MSSGSINFSLEQFNRMFPFYLMIGHEMEILSSGASIQKMYNIEIGCSFNETFNLKRPSIDAPDYTELLEHAQQMIILEYKADRSVVLRGQLMPFIEGNNIVFIGSPWFGSMDQVMGKKLTFDDFAIHDSMIDLLHVLKTQEIATDDMKGLLKTVNSQKNKLKKDQEELERLSLVASANENGVLFIDVEGNISWANAGFTNISGYTADDLNGKAFMSLLQGPKTNKKKIPRTFEKLSSDSALDIEFTMYRSDGSHFWARIKKQEILDEKGKMLDAFVTIEDVSQQKEIEQQLRILSQIAEDNINAVIIADAQGCIEWINKSFSRMTGFTLDEVIGKKPGQVLQGRDTDPETVAYLSRQVKAGEPFNCEILNYSKTGEKYWLRVIGQAIRNTNGELTGFFALEEDITHEKIAKDKLQESEKRLSTLVNNLHTALLLVDENEKVIHVNKRLVDMFKIVGDAKKLRGTTSENLANQIKNILKDPVGFMQLHRRSIEKKVMFMDIEIELSDGQFFAFNFIPIFVDKEYKGYILNFTDITARKHYEKTLEIQEAKYRNIIANMNLGLMEVDRNDNIEYANQSFCEISGFTEEDLIGKKASDIFLLKNSKNLIRDKNQQREKGISDFYELQVKRGDGELRWWLISGAPNYDDQGEIIGSIGIHLDITQQKKLEHQLEAARNKAEEASQAKESFLANMSHEIRTPLNAIVGMVRELSKGQLTQKQNSYLHNAETASQHLLSIINNILDISKIEAGVFVLEERPFDIRILINETISIMSGNASGKMLDLEEVISDNVKWVLIGDQTRIKQILINIIGNAIKFTEKGKVSIHCRGEETKDSGQLILLEVQDTGIGMEQSFSQNLFKKFTQEDRSTARKYGGTGLGMALTYELVKLMGGTIEVTSEKGKGTKVDIRLLLPVGDESMLKSDWEKGDYGLLENIKVLLVEDNKLNRLVASNTLALYNMQITEATNGQEAIECIKKEDFDLILMDLQMPVMDGITATKIIRTKLHKETPIIALTANAFKKEIAVCLSSGMNDYVIKPFEEHELYRLMASNLANIPLELPAVSKDASAEQVVESRQLYDLNKLHEMSRGNDDFVRKMINVFLDSIPLALSQITIALNEEDFITVSKTAHKIKPSIDNMGIVSIKEEIRMIEKLAVEEPTAPELTISIKKVHNVLSQIIVLLKQEEILFPD
jgi:PAS domain S-box-containing protein